MSQVQNRHGLFAELRRREVFSSAAYYFAFAWGSIETLEWVLERWELTPAAWFMPLLATVFVIGFPVTMFVAWMFDFSREGIHRTEASSRKGGLTILMALVLMLGGTAGLYYLIGTPRSPERVLPPSVRPKLAVLPFESFSSNTDNAEFSDAIHYELLNNLGRISSLLVISRQSVMQYRGSSMTVPDIALELKVDALLTGAVQRVDDAIRINVSLRDGRSDIQVWSDDFNFSFTPESYFDVQAEIAETITEKFELALTEADRSLVGTAPTSQLTAYDAYLLGQLKLTNRTVEEAEQAIAYFKDAIRIDPDFALAYVGLANTYDFQRGMGSLPTAQAMELIESLVLEAIELDDRLGEAFVTLAGIRARQGRLDEAEAAYQRAMQLNPNYPALYSDYGTFLYHHRGQRQPALALQKKALELDPRSGQLAFWIGFLLEDMGRVDDAIRYLEKALALSPDHVPARMMLGLSYLSGNKDVVQGWRYLVQATEMDPESPIYPGMLTLVATDHLDEATAQRWADQAWKSGPDKRMSCSARLTLALYRHHPETELACIRLILAEEPGADLSLTILRDLDLANGRPTEARARYQQASPGFFNRSGPRVDRRNLQLAIDLHPVLTRTGEQDLADELLRQAQIVIAGHYRMSSGGYGWADVEAHALQGNKDEALRAMRAAIDQGQHMGWWSLPRRLNLQSLWDDPRFKLMLSELEADAIARRERIHAARAAIERR